MARVPARKGRNLNRLIIFIDGPTAGSQIAANHNQWLVLLSYMVACLAAYTALDFAGNVIESRPHALRARAWLIAGAAAMGIGIWGMHFIAMLAFSLPIPVRYDLGVTMLSLAVAILLSGFAMALVTRGSLPLRRLVVGGIVMGLGVVAMHYIGMAAMRMDASMLYRPGLFALSVLNAMVCSTIALWLVFRLGAQTPRGVSGHRKIASALFMGLAICGMHYTAIYAGVCISPRPVADAVIPLDPTLQTMVIGGVALLFTSIVLGMSAQNQIVSAQLRRQNERLVDQVAECRLVEAALLQAKQIAEAANQAKSDFLSNVSHELRTPMHAILSFSEIGMQRAPYAHREKLSHYFKSIDTSAARLMSMVNDLLDLSKIEVGKMDFHFARTDISAVIHAVVGEFAEIARGRSVLIETHIDAECAEAEIDSSRMHQVLRNLLSNAVKFSPADSRVSVRLRHCEAPDGGAQPWLVLAVEDSGPGIPPEELELVFDKFVQSSKTKTGAGGTGLGLAIVREIMLAHGGQVTACNLPAGGTEFRAILPAEHTIDEALANLSKRACSELAAAPQEA